MKIGAWREPSGEVRFTVWAPDRRQVEIRLESPFVRLLPMDKDERGYWHALIPDLEPGTSYRYRLDGEILRPDPASRFQRNGVHGASSLVEHGDFTWTDLGWAGFGLDSIVFYEIHVGTFTPEGTFEAILPRLAQLKELGVTAVELMPLGEFPGRRNWGYDGVYPFAVQSSYGGPSGLKRLVDACHACGLALVLDVVYNHLGPEGNYLADYGPYFTDIYRTGWGPAVNFDGPGSDEVRNYFLENALFWLRDYHVDALRVDALHAIFDMSAIPFLEELARVSHEYGRSIGKRILVIGESDLNDAKIIRPAEEHGYGFDAFWSDDFHHALHALLTGEREGYYVDFDDPGGLPRAMQDGLVYTGQYSRFRGRRHGNSAGDYAPEQFVVFSQNHDQVGNRMRGERLCHLVPFEAAKSAAALVLLSPYVPLLFMGEEYAETAPFPFFVSHSDHDLIEAVRKGRREEFRSFAWEGDPLDPQDPETFQRAKLNWDLRDDGLHRQMLAFYRELLRVRREVPAFQLAGRESYRLQEGSGPGMIFLTRLSSEGRALVLFNLSRDRIISALPGEVGRWESVLDSEDPRWGNPRLQAPLSAQSAQEVTLHPYQTVVYGERR